MIDLFVGGRRGPKSDRVEGLSHQGVLARTSKGLCPRLYKDFPQKMRLRNDSSLGF